MKDLVIKHQIKNPPCKVPLFKKQFWKWNRATVEEKHLRK